jgi:integrase
MATVFKRDGRPNYYAEFTDATGQRVRKSTGTKHKRDAQAIANKWESDANALRNGIRDKDASLASLLDEYLDYLTGKSPKHLQATRQRLSDMLEPNGWTRPSQITQLGIETTVRQIPHHKTGEPIALRTQSHYLAAAKSFTKWLVQIRKCLVVDPLAAVKKPSFTADRRLVRRFLLPAEWPWLAKTPNALLYQTAIQTGLRSEELGALSESSLSADHIYVPGKHTKNGQDAIQYITPELRHRLEGQLPFRVPNAKRLAELLRRDLGIARWLAYNEANSWPERFLMPANARGQELDFHALRHTCGAWLAIKGTNPKVIQQVMRHSSITLTLDTYGHLMPGAERDAVQLFSEMMDPKLGQ